MKAILATLLLISTGFGCARIYRPMEVAPIRATAQAAGLSAAVALQPWGDNSGYEEKALGSQLRMLALGLENQSSTTIEILGLELPEGASALTPEEALLLVRQKPLLFLLYPVIPGLWAAGSSNHASPGSLGPSDKAIFSGLAIIGLAIGVPNAIVAARSNTRLGALFKAQAWSPGPLEPGQARRGLLFLRSPNATWPLALRVRYRTASGEQGLELPCPGARTL